MQVRHRTGGVDDPIGKPSRDNDASQRCHAFLREGADVTEGLRNHLGPCIAGFQLDDDSGASFVPSKDVDAASGR